MSGGRRHEVIQAAPGLAHLERQERTWSAVDPETVSQEAQVRFLIIVARDAVDAFATVGHQFRNDPRVCVLLDRRRRERRRSRVPRQPERRLQEQRRMIPDYWEDIRFHPVVIVPIRKDEGARLAGFTPQPPSADEVKTMDRIDTDTVKWRDIETWVRNSQYMATHVIPSLMRERDKLRRRADAAERDVARLTGELEHLRSDNRRLETEIGRLESERRAASEGLAHAMVQIGRLANEGLAALEGGTRPGPDAGWATTLEGVRSS